jgi:hypothetical protein
MLHEIISLLQMLVIVLNLLVCLKECFNLTKIYARFGQGCQHSTVKFKGDVYLHLILGDDIVPSRKK